MSAPVAPARRRNVPRRLSVLVAIAAAIGSLTVAAPASAAGAVTVIAHRGDAGAAPERTHAVPQRPR